MHAPDTLYQILAVQLTNAQAPHDYEEKALSRLAILERRQGVHIGPIELPENTAEAGPAAG